MSIIKRFSAALILLCLLSGIFTDTAVAQTSSLQEVITARLTAANVTSVQEWIDGELTAKAGDGSEWIVMALATEQLYDFSSYREALQSHLQETEITSAVTRQKMALCLSMIDGDRSYIDRVAKETIGTNGLMSYVYGLPLIAVTENESDDTSEQIISAILSRQLGDGGWAVAGDVSDVDVTAMVLQSLGVYREDVRVAEAIDKALALLSSRQREDGGYASYGVPNAESVSQVILALSSLGVDVAVDSRFIKNGHSPLDALEGFALENGMYCHKAGGAVDNMASTQALCALVEYERLTAPENLQALSILRAAVPTTATTVVPKNTSGNIKTYITVAIVMVATVAAVLLTVVAKRSRKNIVIIGVIALLLIVVVWVTDIALPSTYYQSADTDENKVIGQVTLSIRCDVIANQSDDAHIPKDGVVLHNITCSIENGDTVYDVLVESAKSHQIPIDHRNGYIRGIAHIYEMDHGDLSGWMYHVNGEETSVACDQYTLSDGDTIEWLYTCEIGQDLT